MTTTIVYKIPTPYGMGERDRIEVYGEADMGSYEWRVVVDGRVTRDTKTEGYGCAEIALRDALIATSGVAA